MSVRKLQNLALLCALIAVPSLCYAQPAVKGFETGLKANHAIQEQFFPYKRSNIRTQGFKTGMTSGIALGTPMLRLNKISNELNIIQKAVNSIRTKVPAYLQTQSDRRRALLEHIIFLQKIRELLAERSIQMKQEIGQLSQLDERNRALISQTENSFFTQASRLEISDASRNFDIFVNASEENVKIRAYLGAIKRFDQWYTQLIEQYDLFIFALEKNKEALIQGITVTEIENVDLGIIKKLQ